jgi:hypothetical protein
MVRSVTYLRIGIDIEVDTYPKKENKVGGRYGQCIGLCAKEDKIHEFVLICMPWSTMSKHSFVYAYFSQFLERSTMVMLFLC